MAKAREYELFGGNAPGMGKDGEDMIEGDRVTTDLPYDKMWPSKFVRTDRTHLLEGDAAAQRQRTLARAVVPRKAVEDDDDDAATRESPVPEEAPKPREVKKGEKREPPVKSQPKRGREVPAGDDTDPVELEDEDEREEEEEEPKSKKRTTRQVAEEEEEEEDDEDEEEAAPKTQGRKTAAAQEDEEEDVTENYPSAGKNDLRVSYVKKKGYTIFDGKKPINASPLRTSTAVNSALEKHIGE